MSIIDKITGRTKKAVADLKGDESLHREGVREERKGQAKEDLARQEARAEAAEAEAERKRQEVDAMESRPGSGPVSP